MSNLNSRIVKYKLEEDATSLRNLGYSYMEIADELNNSGKVPEGDSITDEAVSYFFNNVAPQVNKEIVKSSRERMVRVVENNLSIADEVHSLFGKTKNLLNKMENDAEAKGKIMNPYQFKAVCSEMRELLAQMTDIQREMNDAQNIRSFMEIVLQVINEECPDKLPIIAQRLKMAKGTQWFADIASKSGGGGY